MQSGGFQAPFRVGDIVKVNPEMDSYRWLLEIEFMVKKTLLGTQKDIIAIEDLDKKLFLNFLDYSKYFILVERKQIKEIDLKDFNDLYI